MSPLNKGSLLGPRGPPMGMRPPPPRFGGRLPMPGMAPRMPPPIGPMFGPMRQRMMPPRPGPPRPGPPMMRPGGPPPLFGPRGRGVPPLMPPIMGPRVMGPRGPMIRPGPRGLLLPPNLPTIRSRFPNSNGSTKMKTTSGTSKSSKLEELELKKPWMTDEIRNEIQKKNKLYTKAKKNKDAKEWEEFKDLRNKVTRMIRDAKNEYLAKNPEQGGQKTENKDNTIDPTCVEDTANPVQNQCTESTDNTVNTEISEKNDSNGSGITIENTEISEKNDSNGSGVAIENTENSEKNDSNGSGITTENTETIGLEEETQPSSEQAQS